MLSVKQLLKKLYKECDHSASVVVRIKDEDLKTKIDLPIDLKDLKEEIDDQGHHFVVLDLA